MSDTSELQTYLVFLGIGTAVGGTGQWAVYRNRIPANAHDDAICVYKTGGLNSVKTFGGRSFSQPRFQILTRSLNPDSAETKANAIWAALDGLGKVTMSGTLWNWIEGLGEPQTIGPDSNDRTRFVCNYQAIKRMSA